MALVTDITAPLASSESGALVPRGFGGEADLGLIVGGCPVQILKTTDRGALVKVVACPSGSNSWYTNARADLQGWVAKSALTLKP
ncbi:MAG: hypothetical protein NVS4B6_31210 [Mycobacterium sp.]